MGHRKDRKHREAAPMLAPDAPELRRRVAVLAGQVRELGARVTAPDAGGGAESADRSAERMIAAAERAAAEIRESAQREAARIRAGSVAPAEEAADLLASARRQQHTLAVIAAEIEQLEHSAEALRTQLRSLDGKLEDMIGALSGPAASPGTSRRPHE
jgi:hypothetical protein